MKIHGVIHGFIRCNFATRHGKAFFVGMETELAEAKILHQVKTSIRWKKVIFPSTPGEFYETEIPVSTRAALNMVALATRQTFDASSPTEGWVVLDANLIPVDAGMGW